MKKEHRYLLKHETKKHILMKFQVVVAVVVAYLILLILRYGLGEGFLIGLATWSFFILCTPFADAGFLFDFPLRILAGIKMMYTELGVWVSAIFVNVILTRVYPALYEKTLILQLFKHIIMKPYPFWGIFILSCFGTFFSVYFGDELMDVARHRERIKYEKHRIKRHFFVLLSLIVFVIILYNFLLKELGIDIPLL